METCENCGHYAIYEDGIAGECRKNPPQIIKAEGFQRFWTVFPTTMATDWCGEWWMRSFDMKKQRSPIPTPRNAKDITPFREGVPTPYHKEQV